MDYKLTKSELWNHKWKSMWIKSIHHATMSNIGICDNYKVWIFASWGFFHYTTLICHGFCYKVWVFIYWGYLNCTIPTYYVLCCNWYGFCCKVWAFTNWGFFPLHRSYLLWFLLHDLNFHKLGFFSITKLLLMFFVVGCELSYSKVWFCYYSYFLFFYCWVSSFKSHFFQSGNEKISSIVNMHDFAFNFNFPSLVFVGCGTKNNINNLGV